MTIRLLVEVMLAIPKSLRFCLHYFSVLDAIKLPVIINRKTILKKLSGKVVLDEIKTGIIKIGFSGSYALGGGNYIDLKGIVHFKGKASFARGIQLVVGENGKLCFGKDFRCNSNCIINCNEYILFGNDCLLAWGITCLDSDGHDIIDRTNLHTNNNPKSIKVSNHVWICPGVSLLKGTEIGENCIVATNSVITKSFVESSNCLIGSNKVLKENIEWKD